MNDTLVVKISGEYLKGKDRIIDVDKLSNVANQLIKLKDSGYKIAVIIGGGNILRGREYNDTNIKKDDLDYMGMLATIINSLSLNSILNKLDERSVVFSLISNQLCLKYSKRKAKKMLKKDFISIFAGGTGKVGFSTDTAAAKIAIDIDSKLILMGKSGTDGVYDKDPNLYNDAKLFKKLSYDKVLNEQLKVIDRQSVLLCKENKIEIRVFNIDKENAIINNVDNKDISTVIGE